MPGKELQRGSGVERGAEVKITFIGMVALVVAMLLLGLVVYQVSSEIDKNGRSNDEQPNGLV